MIINKYPILVIGCQSGPLAFEAIKVAWLMTWALNLEHQGTLDSIVECQGVKQGWVVLIASQSLGDEVVIGTINNF